MSQYNLILLTYLYKNVLALAISLYTNVDTTFPSCIHFSSQNSIFIMADGVYSVATQTYVKLTLHAAKRPASSVYGLLLGQEQGQGFSVSDAVPLFHHEAPLAPLLEVVCGMVDAYCQKSQKLKIVGFYYAGSGYSPSDSGNGLSHLAEKVADKVEQNCSRACVLMVRFRDVCYF